MWIISFSSLLDLKPCFRARLISNLEQRFDHLIENVCKLKKVLFFVVGLHLYHPNQMLIIKYNEKYKAICLTM